MKSTVMHHFTSSMMHIFTPTQLRFTVNTININPRDLKGTSMKELKLGTGMWEWTPAAGSGPLRNDSESALLTKIQNLSY